MTHHNRQIAMKVAATAAVWSSLAVLATAQLFYERLSMPDFDQKWDALPNDGKMYCVPTSAMDVLEYMDGHGLSGVAGVTGTYGGGYTAANILNRLFLMGMTCGTDPNKGGSMTPGFTYILNHAGAKHPSKLIFGYNLKGNTEWGENRIKTAFRSGSLINVAYGRYEYKYVYPIGNRWVRAGGHVMAGAGYDYRSGKRNLLTRDPSTPNSTSFVTQGAFANRTETMTNVTLSTVSWGTIAHARYAPQNGNKLAWIDGMIEFRPATGSWTYQAVVTGNAPVPMNPTIRIDMPWQFGGMPKHNGWSLTAREQIVDMVEDLGVPATFYVTPTGRIYHADLETGVQSVLATIKGAKQVVVGGGWTNDLYVLASGANNDSIHRLDRAGNTVASFELPFRAASMQFDPLTVGPAVISTDMSRMLSLDESLATATTRGLKPMPVSGMLAGTRTGVGAPIFRINPDGGEVIVGRKGQFGVMADARDGSAARFVSLAGVADLKTIAPARKDMWIVQNGTSLMTVDSSGRTVASQFDRVSGVAGEFKLNRGYVSPFEERVEDGYYNIDPSEF